MEKFATLPGVGYIGWNGITAIKTLRAALQAQAVEGCGEAGCAEGCCGTTQCLPSFKAKKTAMNVLKPGYIPETWERGEPLRIMQAPQNGVGCVQQATIRFVDEPLFNGTVLIQFRSEDAAEVQEWVNWWHAKS